MFIHRLTQALEDAQIDYAIVGGYAVMLHGIMRGTIDIDLVIKITARDFIKMESTLKSLGLHSRLPVSAQEIFDFREEYIKNRNIVAWNFYNPIKPSELVDIIITHDLKKMKTVIIKSNGFKIKVVSKDDLIKMKLKSGRDQDLSDVQALKGIKK